ncbi:MAG: helix-turn-helix domain-containing protein [Patescibacteria group bacterium]
MNQINTALEEYGFSKNEAKVYLFLISNQDNPAYVIARETLIPRTTVYKTLDLLGKKGFTSSWIKNGVKFFSAESPETLRRHAENKKVQLEQVLPELAHLFSSLSVHPSAKLYQGKEGVKHAFEYMLDVIKAKKLKRVYVYSDHHLTEQFPKYFKSWRARKNKTGAYTFLIVPHGTPMNEDYKSDKYRETRILPPEFSFDGAVDICGPVVAFFSFKEKEIYSIVIESQIIADMLIKFFLHMWTTLEKNKPN